jgi:hypothetical protein
MWRRMPPTVHMSHTNQAQQQTLTDNLSPHAPAAHRN